MKKVLLFFGVLSVGTAHAFDTKAYCRQMSDSAGGSYQLELQCRKMEEEARESMVGVKVPSRVAKYCRQMGASVGGSYQLMQQCVKQEMEAKSRL